MEQLQSLGVMRRVPEPSGWRAHQPIFASRSQSKMHPEWTAPRLRGRAGSSGQPGVPPPPGATESSPREPSRHDPGQGEAIATHQAFRAAPGVSAAIPAARARRRPLVIFIFVCLLGVVTGTGGAYLLVRLSPATAARIGAPGRAAVSAIVSAATALRDRTRVKETSAVTVPLPAAPRSVAARSRAPEASAAAQSGSSLPAEALAQAGAAAKAQAPPTSRNATTAVDDPRALALLQRAERELVERKLEQPTDDNALASYRELAASWPQEKRVAQLGGEIGLAIWSLGQEAQRSGDWREALHYWEIVNTLPPVPRAAMQAAIVAPTAR